MIGNATSRPLKPTKKLGNPLHDKESRRNTEGGTADIGVSADVEMLNYLLLSISNYVHIFIFTK